MRRYGSRRHLAAEAERYRRAWMDALDRLLYEHGDYYGRAVDLTPVDSWDNVLGPRLERTPRS